MPGGKVDPPENFYQAAKRECLEEANIDVELKGILRIEYNIIGYKFMRLKVVFYAEPIDDKQILKTIPDEESEESRYFFLMIN